MELNPNIINIAESATVSLNDKVQRLKAQGKNIISLNAGDPDFSTHPKIIEFANSALLKGETHYCDSRGLMNLREAIAEKYQREYGVKIDPLKEILITSGTIHAYYVLLQSILQPGDEVLVPDPTWMTHANLVNLLGGKAVRVPSNEEGGFIPKPASWDNLLSEKSKAIVLNSPSNPTGAIADLKYLNVLHKFAVDNNLLFICDEVYEKIIFDGHEYNSVLQTENKIENVCVVNSFSKSFAMTGWRIGFLIASSKIIDQAIKASQYSITCVPPFIQIAAAEALNDDEISGWVEEMQKEYQFRKDTVRDSLKTAAPSISGFEPSGAFYYFLNLKNLNIPSLKLAQNLLDSTGVALVPGSVYGECGEGYLRMSLAASHSTITQGLE